MEYNGENKPVNQLTPLISVCIMTYQHAKYIRECLEGALLQKTNFPVEIIVGEDGSNDGTREICIEYAEKYPDRIRLFPRSRKDVITINGKKTGRFNFMQTFKAARGKYIALCEGDDHWSDPQKLQKQVDFLEANSDFAVCFHAAYEVHEGMENRISNPDLVNDVFTIEDLAKGNFLHTPTVVYRNILKGQLPSWYDRIPVGDYPLHMLHSSKGKIKFIREPFAYYRVHGGGAWSGLNPRDSEMKWINVLDILIEAGFSNDVKVLLIAQRRKNINKLLEIDLLTDWNMLLADLKSFAVNDDELYKTWLKSSVREKKSASQSKWEARINRLRNIFKR